MAILDGISDRIPSLGMLNGKRIYENSFLYKHVPLRQHIKKPWMSETYHRRIQKKWMKRFGTKIEYLALETSYGYFVHPELLRALREKATEPGTNSSTNRRSQFNTVGAGFSPRTLSPMLYGVGVGRSMIFDDVGV